MGIKASFKAFETLIKAASKNRKGAYISAKFSNLSFRHAFANL
jgi:hypothetical protein